MKKLSLTPQSVKWIVFALQIIISILNNIIERLERNFEIQIQLPRYASLKDDSIAFINKKLEEHEKTLL